MANMNVAALVEDVRNAVAVRAHTRNETVRVIADFVEQARRTPVPGSWIQHHDDQRANDSHDWQTSSIIELADTHWHGHAVPDRAAEIAIGADKTF